MNEILFDAIRHNSWATRQLITFCRAQDLTEDQLVNATGVGTFGSILATLHHIVTCDGSYVRRLAERELGWVDRPLNGGESSDDDGVGGSAGSGAGGGAGNAVDLATLAEWATDAEQVWEDVLAAPIDVERVVVIDDGLRECRAGVFIAQALNHANHHREQVCAILTGLGIEPPDIQAWEYAWAVGRIWDRTEAEVEGCSTRTPLPRCSARPLSTGSGSAG